MKYERSLHVLVYSVRRLVVVRFIMIFAAARLVLAALFLTALLVLLRRLDRANRVSRPDVAYP